MLIYQMKKKENLWDIENYQIDVRITTESMNKHATCTSNYTFTACKCLFFPFPFHCVCIDNNFWITTTPTKKKRVIVHVTHACKQTNEGEQNNNNQTNKKIKQSKFNNK